ncbi:hypothetical protein [Bradyrhizobium yuanmingense]|uniref:hypothetical protein n=1 Tax=Bradyrhizobium yuanmingense TaxID=108015 RepID=UPI0023B9A31B|nr:hypothetical protein [Bradyrhizobium yuanmingense]MDF0584734.1 hypothetical protein [Bradyrhizobium yuanmingense]
MKNKTKTTITVAPETHYEVRRLAESWGIPIAQAWEVCCHFMAIQAPGRETTLDLARFRQAEAKVEMLKANN